ncbi:hypothetical protein ACQKIC_20490, partial [Peribacillus sp. NPDC046944]|uniref:hypothetical protein n=1 Tax=unclassified Peribacillus TaxID=2675266 RepID=UPI00381DD15D
CHEFKEDGQLDMARSENSLTKWARRDLYSKFRAKFQENIKKGSGMKSFRTPFVDKLRRSATDRLFL